MNADEIQDVDFGELPLAKSGEYENEYERLARILAAIHHELKRMADIMEYSESRFD